MNRKKTFEKKILKRILSVVLAATLVVIPPTFGGAAGYESPQAIYTGISTAPNIIKNLNYNDINGLNTQQREAVYETSALGAMKGFGTKQFGLNKVMSKVDVISALYRAIGREADAQKVAEALDNARQIPNKKTDSLNMWADGYLQLAMNDGLISQQDLTDAFTDDQTSLSPESFHRNASAQRQEMGYWLGKLLENAKALQPEYGQQTIFNSFNDWRRADPIKVPYLEAILQNNIMNGTGNGNFNPTGYVTKAQAAQVIKNGQDLILPVRSYLKQIGTIENIASTLVVSDNKGIINETINVRNSDGMLYQINAEVSGKSINTNKNELDGINLPLNYKDLVVYKNGKIGNGSLLKKGDRLEYVVSTADNSVQFVNVYSSTLDTNYYVANINSIDTNNMLMDVNPELKLDYPDINIGNITKQFTVGNKTNLKYKISKNVLLLIDRTQSDIKNLSAGTDVIITVKNNIITEIRTIPSGNMGESGVVKGIVEDNNPQLGYITLYSEDGNGSNPEAAGRQYLLRTYNYSSSNDVEALKNHSSADPEEIETGDTVFLKLDDKLEVVSLSAVDNYTVKYGKVISKKANTLAVEFDNGVQQILDVDKNIFVVAGNKAVSYSRIKDGDRIKMLLNITNKATTLKEITIQGNEHFITNIYKGKVSRIDDISDKLLASNLEVLRNGQWVRTNQKGTTSLDLADGYSLYFDNRKINVKNANRSLKQNEAYIAVEKDYGGNELAVLVSYRNEDDTEGEPYNDSVSTSETGSGEFTLSKNVEQIKVGDGTIVVKDGRLVSGNSISPQDTAYVVANKSYDSGDFIAGIVQINERSDINFAQIYRGRINKINKNKNFTVESFSQLKGLTWQFSNTPKTFKITPDTIIMDDSGLANQRDFIDYGDTGFKDKSVYVVADNTNALLISTVPFGTFNAKGEIIGITGGTVGDDGSVLTQPTALKLHNVKTYDLTTNMWTDSNDSTLNILKNSIVFKDNKIVDPSDLKQGDNVRVIKKDALETGDAYIVIVES